MKLRPRHVDWQRAAFFGLGVSLAIVGLLIPALPALLVSFYLLGWTLFLSWPSLTWDAQLVEIRNLRTHRIPSQELLGIYMRHQGFRGVSFDARTRDGERIRVGAMYIPRGPLRNEPRDRVDYRLRVINSAIKSGQQLK